MVLINLPYQKVSLSQLLQALREGESLCCRVWGRITVKMVRRCRWVAENPAGGRSLRDESGMLI